MGFEPLELGWLYYANDLGFGVADLEHIEVLDTSIEDVVVGFKPHEKNDLQLQWQDKEANRYLQMA